MRNSHTLHMLRSLQPGPIEVFVLEKFKRTSTENSTDFVTHALNTIHDVQNVEVVPPKIQANLHYHCQTGLFEHL